MTDQPAKIARVKRRLSGVARRRSLPNVTDASAPFLEPILPREPSSDGGPRVVLLNDCRDQVNFGANALVDGLIEILATKLPTATLVPVPSHWLLDTSHGLGAFVGGGVGLHQPEAVYPSVADEFEAVADAWLSGEGGPGAAAFLERFEGADLIVLNGEGSIYRTNLSAVRELFLVWLAKNRLGIPTMFCNGLVHLTDVVPVLPAMVRKTFPTLDAVAVREGYSLRNLEQYAPEVNARLFPDAAFTFTPADAPQTPVVKSIRERIGDAPFFCFDPGPMPMDHRSPRKSGLYDMITALQQKVLPKAVFITNGPADSFIKQVAHETDSVYIDTVVDYHEFMAIVGDADFLVSGRYHNVILAAIMGCPSVPFASASHKVHGACEMLDGLIGTPYDGTHIRPHIDAIVSQAAAYLDDRPTISAQLQRLCEQRSSEAMEIGTLAGEVLSANARTTSVT